MSVEYQRWWQSEQQREVLLKIAQTHKTPLYVYSENTLRQQIRKLLSITAVDTFYYAIKANYHKDILKVVYSSGFGFECVSPGEVAYILNQFPSIERNKILFTPNFAPREEYEEAFKLGITVNVDSLYPLQNWPEVFRGQRFFLRIDPGTGRGHHKYVQTAGKQSKFGIAIHSAGEAADLVKQLEGSVVIGLHSHSGSGILKETHNWVEVADILYGLKKKYFDKVTSINVGGGLGVVQNDSQELPLDLSEVGRTLAHFKNTHTDVKLSVEPGRFLVADCGVLLCKITQIKSKESTKRYVGVNVGFNTLIRPVLYGAYHEIVNLSRCTSSRPRHEEGVGVRWWPQVDVVGMICETGDVFGSNRSFPESSENDVVLIATVGAYGRSMSSHYNMRPPAEEYFLQEKSKTTTNDHQTNILHQAKL